MYVIKLKKRPTFSHNESITIDANFEDGTNAFNKSFVFPIDSTELEVHTKVKSWLEGKEASDLLIVDPAVPIDVDSVVTGREDRIAYDNKKAELEEIMDLVDLGAKDANDLDVKALQDDVKLKYKDGYKKEKK